MTSRRTISRTDPDMWLLTREGDCIRIGRSEHSDWLEVRLEAVPQLLADLKELVAADEPPKELLTLMFVR